jgi:hypothetical protein
MEQNPLQADVKDTEFIGNNIGASYFHSHFRVSTDYRFPETRINLTGVGNKF